ncbi:MAG: hypothetical protein KKH61_12910, partial [Gammaproteobacteria bacterium]|nr:hypothetical protein [Gammaproteobacteria bacterium]
MTKHDLKELAVIGAELGAAKAENEKLRAEVEALRVALLGIASVNPAERGIEWAKSYASDGLKGAGSELYARWLETFKEAEALRKDADRRAALSQQAESEELDYSYHSHEFAKAQPEPTDTFTAVEMATAAAQGFRDGQAAVEQAAAQDEQQPYMWVRVENDYIEDYTQDANLAEIWLTEDWPVTMPLYAAPIAQTALQLEQSRPANKLRALAEIWDQNADEADEFGNAQAAEALRLAAFE